MESRKQMTIISSERILIIEDEGEIANFIQTELQCEGYQTLHVETGTEGLLEARRWQPDLIILDRMLPGMDGLSICRRLRESSSVPIIMLTALGASSDRVQGLDSGANDYLVKPFDLDELLARIRVQFRLHQPNALRELFGADVRMDLRSHEAWRNDYALTLTPTEFDLLKYFLENPNQALSRQQILIGVWGFDFGGEDNVLEVYVGYLRRKLETATAPRLIHTVRGIGYMFRAPA